MTNPYEGKDSKELAALIAAKTIHSLTAGKPPHTLPDYIDAVIALMHEQPGTPAELLREYGAENPEPQLLALKPILDKIGKGLPLTPRDEYFLPEVIPALDLLIHERGHWAREEKGFIDPNSTIQKAIQIGQEDRGIEGDPEHNRADSVLQFKAHTDAVKDLTDAKQLLEAYAVAIKQQRGTGGPSL